MLFLLEIFLNSIQLFLGEYSLFSHIFQNTEFLILCFHDFQVIFMAFLTFQDLMEI